MKYLLEKGLRIEFHHQPNDYSIGQFIKSKAKNSEKIWIASAFLTEHGLKLLNEVSDKCKEIKIICGIWQNGSDLRTLYVDWIQKDKLEGRVFDSYDFHSKLYLFESNNEITIIIGSANFTSKGVGLENKNNEEIIVTIVGDKKQKLINDIIMYFWDLWTKRTKSVKRFLDENPNYHFNKDIDRPSTLSFSNSVDMNCDVQFTNKVNETLKKHGQQTILKRFDIYEKFDQYWSETRQKSVNKWKIRIMGVCDSNGSLYKVLSSNKKTHNYRIQIYRKGKAELNKHIKIGDLLKYEFDFENEICTIQVLE